MPLFAALFASVLGGLSSLLLAIKGAEWGLRVTIVVAAGAAYLAIVVAFSAVVAPWFAAITSSGYGLLLGLLFPPAAGTVLAVLAGFWTLIIGKRLSVRLLKMTAP